MARPDLEDVPVDLNGAPLPPEPSLEGPEWADRRPLTADEEGDAWKIAQLTVALMGPDWAKSGWERWEDVVRTGASLLEISRRYVVAEAGR